MHRVQAKSLVSAEGGMNIYRGCLHGCIYCDSRSSCYGFRHSFEDIEVKENAPELLEHYLRTRLPCMLATGSMSDPYLPLEEDLGLTRKCLELIYQYGFGIAVLTKSTLIRRDLALLQAINRRSKAVVQLTLTTYDDELCKLIEPGVAPTSQRFAILQECQQLGIPTIVWLSPLLPFINDTKENIAGLLDLCAKAKVKGIICFGMGMTLREGSREYYYSCLDKNFPYLKSFYQRTFGNAYVLNSPRNKELMAYFKSVCKMKGIMADSAACFAYLRDFPLVSEQLSLI